MASKSSLLPAKSKGGRPTLLDDSHRRNRLIGLIARGVPMVHACSACRVNYQTFLNYREKNPGFREELEEAVAAAIEKHLERIEAAAKTDWRSAAWMLEHVHPEHFAKNRIEITGANGGPIAGAIALYLPQKDNGNGGARVLAVDAVKEIENGE
jgi:hypothetical protein